MPPGHGNGAFTTQAAVCTASWQETLRRRTACLAPDQSALIEASRDHLLPSLTSLSRSAEPPQPVGRRPNASGERPRGRFDSTPPPSLLQATTGNVLQPGPSGCCDMCDIPFHLFHFRRKAAKALSSGRMRAWAIFWPISSLHVRRAHRGAYLRAKMNRLGIAAEPVRCDQIGGRSETGRGAWFRDP